MNEERALVGHRWYDGVQPWGVQLVTTPASTFYVSNISTTIGRIVTLQHEALGDLAYEDTDGDDN